MRRLLGGCAIALAVLGAPLAARMAGCTASAQPSAPAVSAPTPEAAPRYADLLVVDRAGEGFVARQLRESRTYPYLDRANRLLAQGRKQEARAELVAYLERDPADVKVRYELGVLLASLGDARGAEREMTRVLEERPGFAPALLYRADARRALGDEAGALDDFLVAARAGELTPADRTRALDSAVAVAIRLGRDEVALRALDELEAAPREAARDLVHAQLLTGRGDLDGALALLARVAASDAPSAERREALSRISVLEVERGRLVEARAAAEAALALVPDDPTLLRRLAEIATRQHDDRAAVAYLERAARVDPSPDVRRAEVYAAQRAGDTRRAALLLRGLVQEEAPGSAQAAQDRTSLAMLEAQLGRHGAAAELYLEAYREGGKKDATLLASAARETAASGQIERAIPLYERALAARSLPAKERARLAEELAYLQLDAGRRSEALRSLAAARELGGDSARIEQTRGDLLLAEGDAAGALAAFRAAQARRSEPRSALGAAYALVALGKPGLAVPEVRRALDGSPSLPADARRAALRTLGFLYAELGEPARAAEAWSAVLRQEKDDGLALRLAREERLAGDLAAAHATLASIDADALAPPARAELLDERAALARAEALRLPADSASEEESERRRLLRAAASDLEQANALAPSAERAYQLGLAYLDLDEPERAIPPLERSLAESFVPNRAATLGYAYQRVGRLDEAGDELARALEADPDLLAVRADLAGIRVAQARNAEAIRLYEQAIDDTALEPADDPAERAALEERRLEMRRRVSELSRQLSLLAYTSICFGSNDCEIGSTAPLSAGASKSQGGVEVAVRPPVIGYRDGRIFEVISRLLFEQEVNSIEPRGSTSVVTLGVRYKPLRAVDGYLSAERLFGAGSDARDNVLLRGTWGWQRGYAMQPGVPRWWYTTLYADVARTLESPRDWFFYTEARHGMTFSLGTDDTMLTPHLYARGRFQTGDGEDFDEVDLGLGVVLRWLFRADRTRDFQSSVELLPRIGHDVVDTEGRDLTVSLTAIVRF